VSEWKRDTLDQTQGAKRSPREKLACTSRIDDDLRKAFATSAPILVATIASRSPAMVGKPAHLELLVRQRYVYDVSECAAISWMSPRRSQEGAHLASSRL
jgi:hypothetical protein